MADNIFQTSVVVFIAALLIIKLMPDAEKLPTKFMAVVLGAFAGSFVAALVSALFLIWAN